WQNLTEKLPMMQYVHSYQIIHRDIKPANLIRREQDKKLVLIDFGAVKDKVSPVRADSSEQTALTAYAIGTPGYAPPEQMAMRPVYASDIYAIGVTCVYLLTAKSPKDLDYDPATGELLWRDQVHISEHFAQVLEKMLDISVRHRYQSAEAILRDLDLEPYLESLAQNMAVQPSSGPLSGPHSGSTSGSLRQGTPSSPTSRMAAAIRAQRERSATKSGTTGVGRRGRRSLSFNGTYSDRASHSSATSASGHLKKSGPMSADDIKTYYVKGMRDFSMQSFERINLARVNLSHSNFTQSQLPGANLQGADLTSGNLGRANLVRASLKNARLERAYFNYANLEGADLRGACLAGACLTNANLRGANLCGADLTGAQINSDQLAMARTNWATIYPNGKRGLLQG
ncbi:MAG: serine/threonine protein kinase, partial [Leptolyngbya sp. SIO4C5]|nr:serine/threonine protein kinase [Leptolyngbya sp. SIO4C5]